MNWEVAKNWLIAAFLILDLILGWQLYESHIQTYGYVESYSDLLANTKTVLADHGFTLQAHVPESQPEMVTFKANWITPKLDELAKTVFPNGKILYTSTTQIQDSEGQIKVRGETWQIQFQPPLQGIQPVDLLKTAFHGQLYTFDKYSSTQNISDYLENYNNFPVFDVHIQIRTGSHGEILGYSQQAIHHIQPIGRPKPVISAIDALNSLAESVDKTYSARDNVILGIQLGYARKVGVGKISSGHLGQQLWFPVWRIITPSQSYDVNALTGEVDNASSASA